MSLYRKSLWFLVWVLALFFTLPLWMSLLVRHFGEAGAVAGGLFGLSQLLAAPLLFRCPACGLSPFLSKRGWIGTSRPWPRKTCGECGHDHTAVDTSGVI